MLSRSLRSAHSVLYPCITTTSSFTARMSSSSHLERTGESTRDPAVKVCTVNHISDISPTTKLLRLLSDHVIPFKAGQWVDFSIPGTDLVGGYSICSAPGSNPLELAVKCSTHPPAQWVHTACKVGERVEVRVGGDVYMEEDGGATKVVLLVAGGIGINPLLSIIKASAGSGTKYHLLYSASSEKELIFRSNLEELAAANGNISIEFYITNGLEFDGKSFKRGRISPGAVNDVIANYRKSYDIREIRCFICGPPPMIDYLEKHVDMKCEFERWW